MMEASEILGWVGQLPKGSRIGVDDGGLCLRVVGQEDDHWLEVGGLPAEPDPAPADPTHIGWPAAKDLIESIQVEANQYDENEDSYPVLGNVKAATLVALGLVKERQKLAPGPRATIIGAKEGIKIEVSADAVRRYAYDFTRDEWRPECQVWRYPITRVNQREICFRLPEYDARLVAAALEADSI